MSPRTPFTSQNPLHFAHNSRACTIVEIGRLLVRCGLLMALLQAATLGFANAQAPKENVLANEFPRNVFLRGNPTDVQWRVETDPLEVELKVQFDAVVFPKDGNSQGARARLESLLDLEIEEIHRTCRLSREQKKKLEMLGRGDIKRFFDRVEERRPEFEVARKNFNAGRMMLRELEPLSTEFQNGPFGDDSFFAKTLKKIEDESKAAPKGGR